MGGSVSCFRDNQGLVDSLMETCELPKDLERIMRLVDRGFYSTKPKDRIYSDSAWRSGNLHLSSPSIYCTVLREMELKPGISVLNIGSGTGFLSTMFGLVLGSNGVNHGIEVSASNFDFAKSRLAEFLTTSDAIYEYDFCPPQFVLGNIFSLVPSSPQTSCQTVSTETFAPDPPGRFLIPNPSLSTPIPGLSDSSEEIHQQPSQTQHPREEGASQTSDSEEDEDDEDNTGDDEPIDHEPVINCSGDVIIEMPPLVEVPFQSATTETGDVPQFYSYHDTPSSPTKLSMWPMYDRIYVGSAITTQAQLSAILRLLKVGGFMIAPVNDRFMKIRRTEKNKTTACSLLSVSFASLIPPGKNATKIDPLPERSVERLERLASRAIRRILRRIINARRGGPPVLGRHVEVSDNEEEKGDDAQEEAASNESPVKAVHTNGDALRPTDKVPTGTDEVDHKAAAETTGDVDMENRNSTQDAATPFPDSASSSLGSQASNSMNKRREPEFDAREPSPSKKRCEEESRPPPGRFESQASPASNDEPTQETETTQGQEREADLGRARSRIYSPYVVLLASILNPRTRVINLRQLEQLRESEGGSGNEEDNEVDTSTHRNRDSGAHSQSGEQSEQENDVGRGAGGDGDEDDETDRRGRRKKKTKFEWVPQSYTYRDEMYCLLNKELDVPEFLAQRIMAVI